MVRTSEIPPFETIEVTVRNFRGGFPFRPSDVRNVALLAIQDLQRDQNILRMPLLDRVHLDNEDETNQRVSRGFILVIIVFIGLVVFMIIKAIQMASENYSIAPPGAIS